MHEHPSKVGKILTKFYSKCDIGTAAENEPFIAANKLD